MNTSTTNASTISSSRDIFLITTVLNLIFGLPSNVYVLQMIARAGSEALASDFFGLNLALIEILFCLLSVAIIVQSNLKLYMSLLLFSSGFVYVGRPWFQCCICLERYLAVVHPVVFLRYKLLRYKMVCSGVVWVLVIGVSLLSLKFLDFVYIHSIYICSNILILFSVNVFCCLAVLRVLKSPAPGDGDREKKATNNIKMRAFRIILMMLLLMGINYIPIIITVPFVKFFTFEMYNNLCNTAFFIIVITAIAQPMIYIHRAGKLPCSKYQ